MKKICVIADTHKQHRSLSIPDCDILIHCGDICSFHDGDLAVLEDIDLWFSECPAKEIVCIGGNHDYLLENKQFTFEHAVLLQDESLIIDGVHLYGSPWCPDLQGFAFYRDDEGLSEAWSNIPAGVDILITHTPPAGVLDLPTSKLAHLGCPMLRGELERISPALHVFGHVHASAGELTSEGIQFINASVVAGRNLEVRSTPTLVEIDLANNSCHTTSYKAL